MNKLRGQIIKQENMLELRVERRFLTKNYVLRLNKNLCNGCGVCFQVCPHEAIIEFPPTVFEGHLIEKPVIDIDESACVMCGECAVLCPLNALSMEVDGKEIATIVENDAFPVLLKEINIMKDKCVPTCELRCQEECPTKAIKISTTSENGEILEIDNIQVDESLCFNCRRCELTCNQEAILVKKPFIGRVNINADACPEGCVACAEICPTHAIQIDEGKPKVSVDFCIFCSACEKICPKQLIEIHRDWIFHSEVKAAAWLTALRKLTSYETISKELRLKSGKRRANAVRSRTVSPHSNSNPTSCSKTEEFLKIPNDCRK